MPFAPPHPCNHPGCKELTTQRYCEAHCKQARQAENKRRGSSTERGYDAKWRRYRLWFLARNPLCADPFKVHGDRPEPANIVDHITPHGGDYERFWDRNNHQPLCVHCHQSLKQREEAAIRKHVG